MTTPRERTPSGGAEGGRASRGPPLAVSAAGQSRAPVVAMVHAPTAFGERGRRASPMTPREGGVGVAAGV